MLALLLGLFQEIFGDGSFVDAEEGIFFFSESGKFFSSEEGAPVLLDDGCALIFFAVLGC
jgi:hypothetical protein